MFALYSIYIISVLKVSLCRNIYTHIKFYKIGRNLCYMYNLDFFLFQNVYLNSSACIDDLIHNLRVCFRLLNMQIKLKSWDFRVTGDDITH